MNSPRWTLALGGALTLALSAWVSASGAVGIFARQSHQPQVGPPAPGSDMNEANNVAPQDPHIYHSPQPGDTLVSFIVWGLKIAVLLVAAAVLVAVLRGLLARWRDRERVARPSTAAFETVPEVLLRRAAQQEESLTGGRPTDAIVACWVSLEESIAAAGVPDDPARTSAELVVAVLERLAVDRSALEDLSGLYREARFSAHQLGETERDRARGALRRIHADLLARSALEPAR